MNQGQITPGARVKIRGSTTHPGWNGKLAVVVGPSSQYPGRLEVVTYHEGLQTVAHLYAHELQPVPPPGVTDDQTAQDEPPDDAR